MRRKKRGFSLFFLRGNPVQDRPQNPVPGSCLFSTRKSRSEVPRKTGFWGRQLPGKGWGGQGKKRKKGCAKEGGFLFVRKVRTWAIAVRRGSFQFLFLLNSGRFPKKNRGNSILNFGSRKNGLNRYGPSSLDAAFFGHSWKLAAYSGAFLLAVDNFSFLLTVGAFLLQFLVFLLTVGAFFAYSGKVPLIRALRDCKRRSSTVSKNAPTVSKKASPKNS